MIAPLLFMMLAAAPVDPMTSLPQQQGCSLPEVKRIYVDRLTGGETAAQMRDMIIAALQQSKQFILTENEERADAVLRGAAEDLVFTDKFNSSESLNAHATTNFGTKDASSAKGRYANLGVGDSESTHIEERKHEATAAVRLVNKDGDVIWSTTQESLGGKFRGASADVAERVSRQLSLDFDRARKGNPSAAGSANR